MRSLWRLFPYLAGKHRAFWGGMGLLILSRLLEATIPLGLMMGIDSVARALSDGTLSGGALAGSTDAAQVRADLMWVSAMILVLVLARLVCVVVGRRAMRRVGVALSYDLRNAIYAHLQRMGPGFFGRYGTGDLMARAINDLAIVRQVVAGGLRTAFVLGCSALFAVGFMLHASVWLTSLLLLPMPVVAISAYLLSRRIYARSVAVQEGFSTLSDRVQENFNGIRTVQAQSQEAGQIEAFYATNAGYAERYRHLIRAQSLLSATMPALGGLCGLIVLGAGGSQVLAGTLSVGTFSAFFSWLAMVLGPVRESGNLVNLFQRGAAASARIFEILDTKPEIEDRPTVAPRALEGGIRIRHLTYRYPGSPTPALHDISIDVKAGETIALIGRVGSGKSTLLSLIARLLDPPPRSVALDDVDVRDLPLGDVRRQVALVPQDPFLFGENVKHNIAYDDPGRADREVWEASEVSDLRVTLEGFADGLETIVGERGVTLSGGQKQRSTLARGVIRDAPILLLDDCFSSVDTETEENILERLADRRGGRSTIIVSNRVSTVRHATRVYVLDAGRIVECGTHEALVRDGGLYAGLARSQMSGAPIGAPGDAALARSVPS